ncbi:MAG: hypothetical protein AAGH90_03670, partial [Pseudomonadota bacterium]
MMRHSSSFFLGALALLSLSACDGAISTNAQEAETPAAESVVAPPAPAPFDVGRARAAMDAVA